MYILAPYFIVIIGKATTFVQLSNDNLWSTIILYLKEIILGSCRLHCSFVHKEQCSNACLGQVLDKSRQTGEYTKIWRTTLAMLRSRLHL